MIDGVEAARIRQQSKADCTDQVSQNEIDDLPLISHVIVARDKLLKLLAYRRGDRFHQFQNGALRNGRERLQRRLQKRECFDSHSGRGQRAQAQQTCNPRHDRVGIICRLTPF